MHSEHWTFSVSVVHVCSYTEKWFVFRTVQLPVSSLVLVLELSASRFSWRCWVVDFCQISFPASSLLVYKRPASTVDFCSSLNIAAFTDLTPHHLQLPFVLPVSVRSRGLLCSIVVSGDKSVDCSSGAA